MRRKAGERLPAWVPLAGLAAYLIQAIAWPFDIGRDGGAFLQHYLDLFEASPLLPTVASYRTPLPSLWYGLMLDYAGAWVLEAVQAVALVVAAVCAYRIGLPWGRTVAAVLAAAVIGHPWYGALYHRIDSDGMFAFVLLMWVSYAITHAGSTRATTWVFHGAWLFGLMMVRPAALVFVPFLLLPLVLVDRPWRVRMLQTTSGVVVIAVLVLAYSGVNYARFGFFGLSRLTNATQPFMRVIVKDRLVDPRNGPASAELAAAIESELVPHDPYRALNLSTEALLKSGSVRLYSDIVSMSDRIWGWESNYAKLRDVSIESIRANPAAFILGVATTTLHSLMVKHTVATPRRRQGTPDAGRPAPAGDADIVPYPYQDMWSGAPDNRYDPAAPAADAAARLRAQAAEVQRREAQLPVRNGVETVSRVLNRIGLLYAPMIVAVLVGLLAIPFMCLSVDANERVLAAIFLLSLAMLVATFAGQVPAIIQYRLPLDPVFLAAACVGGIRIRQGRALLVKAARASVPAASIGAAVERT